MGDWDSKHSGLYSAGRWKFTINPLENNAGLVCSPSIMEAYHSDDNSEPKGASSETSYKNAPEEQDNLIALVEMTLRWYTVQ